MKNILNYVLVAAVAFEPVAFAGVSPQMNEIAKVEGTVVKLELNNIRANLKILDQNLERLQKSLEEGHGDVAKYISTVASVLAIVVISSASFGLVPSDKIGFGKAVALALGTVLSLIGIVSPISSYQLYANVDTSTAHEQVQSVKQQLEVLKKSDRKDLKLLATEFGNTVENLSQSLNNFESLRSTDNIKQVSIAASRVAAVYVTFWGRGQMTMERGGLATSLVNLVDLVSLMSISGSSSRTLNAVVKARETVSSIIKIL
ncbi:MAG: hypothetical protein A4S09_10510 [Proteobacteria bacterium SG_bin7]|nr:MAG: hypothetical protein A4S09_10510 [Proteobacteria bacterium SG_bin7]